MPFTTTSTDVINGFTNANALATLLTTEGLLFAALGLAANLSEAGKRRLPKLPVPGAILGGAAVAVLAVVALGAVAAWTRIFVCEGFPGSFTGAVIAGTLLLAIVAQPVLATLLGLGLRKQK
jgi:hypothetical protein